MSRKLIALLCAATISLAVFGGRAWAAFDESKIESGAAVLMDAASGTELFAKNSAEKLYPASTTKILTALIVLEKTKLTDEVTIGAEIRKFNSKNSLMKVKEGETVSVEDLLYGMLLVSGNDAAASLAVHVGDSIEGFAALMNQKAKEIGMINSKFVNPHGVHDDEHFTTAGDLARLARYAIQNETLMKIVGTASYTDYKNREFFTSNRLISTKESDADYHYASATGMKTGSTPDAHACLVATANKSGVNMIAVIMKDESKDGVNRWQEARDLFEYGFANLDRVPLLQLAFPKTLQSSVQGAKQNDPSGGILTMDLIVGDDVITGFSEDIDALRASPEKVEVIPVYDEELTAPISAGDVVGKATIKCNGLTFTVDLVAQNEVLAELISAPAPTSDLIAASVFNSEIEEKPSFLWLVFLSAGVLVLAGVIGFFFLKGRLFGRRSHTGGTPRRASYTKAPHRHNYYYRPRRY